MIHSASLTRGRNRAPGSAAVNRLLCMALAMALSSACVSGPTDPAPLTVGTESCAQCRMAVSNQAFAAQLVAPGEEPLFFDDIGCLSEYLSRHTRLAPRSMAYVADHTTRAWIPAATALYTRNLELDTPMGSHLIAHGSAATQQADLAARSGVRVTVRDLFPLDVPDGTR
jgi:copper chaperone NosL